MQAVVINSVWMRSLDAHPYKNNINPKANIIRIRLCRWDNAIPKMSHERAITCGKCTRNV